MLRQCEDRHGDHVAVERFLGLFPLPEPVPRAVASYSGFLPGLFVLAGRQHVERADDNRVDRRNLTHAPGRSRDHTAKRNRDM